MTQSMKFLIPSLLVGSFVLMLPADSHAAVDPSTSSTTTTYTVTIDSFLDGQMTTADSAGGASFPMYASWHAKSLGGVGNGQYTLGPTGYNSPNAYEAVTSPMTAGSSYSTHQLNSWGLDSNGTQHGNGEVAGARGRDCNEGSPFVYNGFSTGSTLADAAAATPTFDDHAMFTNLSQNEYVIIWNGHCLTPTNNSWNPNPGNNATTTSAALTQISWNAVSDSYGTVTYDYEIANSSVRNDYGGFQSPVYAQNGLTTPSIQTPGTPDGTYYWHVRAVDSNGNRTSWSPVFKLTVTN